MNFIVVVWKPFLRYSRLYTLKIISNSMAILFLLVGITIAIILYLIVRKRLDYGTQLGSGMTYVCMNCGHKFSGRRCPKCGSKSKKVQF